MWQDSRRISADSSQEVDDVPQILVNGYSFAERCQRLGKAIEWIKREMVSITIENGCPVTKWSRVCALKLIYMPWHIKLSKAYSRI